MSLSVIGFLTAQVVVIVALAGILVQAFRTHVSWGFGVLLFPMACVAAVLHVVPPAIAGSVLLFGFIGMLVFVCMHLRKAGYFFLAWFAGFASSMALMFTSPTVIAYYGQHNPGFLLAVKAVNPSAYNEAQKVAPSGEKLPPPKPTPHEVRDLAENEVPDSAAPPADPNAAQRAAYTKHAKELNTLYQQLNVERPKLKPGSPAVAAFNAKAARYQQGLQTLTEEKTRLDALDHASNLNAEAAAALVSLQTSAQNGDYDAFAGTLKKSLSDYRQTPAFPQIVAVARPLLQQATPDKVLAGLQNKAAGTVRAEFDKTTKKVQGIVNQVPQIVTPPPGTTDVYKYGYHPGAEKPNYAADNLIATRELWKGEYSYIDGVPGVFYRSADCEFNPQTKFFYLSRTVPKKKLTDAEYQELTKLYHQLGEQEKAIAAVPPPSKDAERVSNDLATLKAQLDGYAMK